MIHQPVPDLRHQGVRCIMLRTRRFIQGNCVPCIMQMTFVGSIIFLGQLSETCRAASLASALTLTNSSSGYQCFCPQVWGEGVTSQRLALQTVQGCVDSVQGHQECRRNGGQGGQAAHHQANLPCATVPDPTARCSFDGRRCCCPRQAPAWRQRHQQLLAAPDDTGKQVQGGRNHRKGHQDCRYRHGCKLIFRAIGLVDGRTMVPANIGVP